MTTPDRQGPPPPREGQCVTSARALAAAREAYPPRFQLQAGQRLPRRFSAASWAFSLPGFLELFSGEVPEDYWAVAVIGDDGSEPALATVACPCGEEPEVAQMSTAICPGQNCGRTFILLGDRIRVARFEEPEGTSAGD